MSRSAYLFTSESVSEGHPDKVCDRISDTVVDMFLAEDPNCRVACECLTTTNRIVLAGETRGPKFSDARLEEAVRAAVKDIGYEQDGFHWKTAEFSNYLHEQSAEIAQGVDESGEKDLGAGDQGIMFGFACNETEELMPAPIQFSHNILKVLADARKSGKEPKLLPDMKSQVSLAYNGDGKPQRTTSIVLSTQHTEDLDQDAVREIVKPYIEQVLPDGWMCPDEELYVNPTGKFVIGGPDGDAGLTGRKIIVDTYGGAAPHGGGAFSGKDPSKVDRSAAYATRYLAKNVVAAGLADKCTLQVAYAIGVSKPLSIFIDLHGTGRCDEDKLAKRLNEVMNLSPGGIRKHLQLQRPIYARSAAYGHFGRTPDSDGGFSWEKTDLVDDLKDLAA